VRYGPEFIRNHSNRVRFFHPNLHVTVLVFNHYLDRGLVQSSTPWGREQVTVATSHGYQNLQKKAETPQKARLDSKSHIPANVLDLLSWSSLNRSILKSFNY
jgi:hypothetical protein